MKNLKTFKRYLKEEREKYYTLDLSTDMTKEDVVYSINQLIPLTTKMLKESDILITIEPIFEDEEQ